MPCTYCNPSPSLMSDDVASFTRPPRPPPVSLTDDVPWSSDARSIKNDGIVEKSVMPSIGLLMRIPFHVTCVWLGDVPRNATVDRVARPWLLTKIDELNVSTSAIDSAMFSFSMDESSTVFCMPISFIGRLAV